MKLLWLALLLPMLAVAAEKAKPVEQHLHAQLIAEVIAVSPNSAFTAGVEIKLDPGWHVYWQNPGDYGESPTLKWDEQNGFKASDFRWPVPRKIQVGTIVSFGYEDELILPFQVESQARLDQAEIVLQPKLKWLVCKEICIPGSVRLSLKIPVSKNGNVNDSEAKSRLDAVQSNLPLPQPPSFMLSGTQTKDDFDFTLTGLPPHSDGIGFFPVDGDDVNYSGPSEIKNTSSDQIKIKLRKSDRLSNFIGHFPALLVLPSIHGNAQSYTIDIPLDGDGSKPPAKIFFPILFAILGGLLLNLMPCVFPVLSIKAMSVLRMSGEGRQDVKKMGWAYTLGILVSFWILVSVLIFLRAGGRQIGWGFQLQSPHFVFILACVLFAFALNLLGLFEFSGRFMSIGDDLTRKSGFSGSFFTGVLATLVATPCSAPFMGSAVGFALSQSSWIIFLIFSGLGLGLAAPYLMICYMPGLGKILPKPGVWMETFQQAMGFLILGTIVWLAWVFSHQVSSTGLVILLTAFVSIGFAVWLAKKLSQFSWSGIAPLIGVIAVGFLASRLDGDGARSETLVDAQDANGLQWEKFSPEKVRAYQAQGRPVFVDFTAAWCVSCQVNEALVFRSDAVKEKLKELHFVLLKGDWTNQDPVITKSLQAFQRQGVPLYLIYPKGKDVPAIPLPEVINAGMVLTELEKLK